MAFIAMSHRVPAPLLQGQPWLSAAQGSDLTFLVSTEEDVVWRVRVEPDQLPSTSPRTGDRD